MPRTVQEVLAHADELAARFEAFDPADAQERELDAGSSLANAVILHSHAERLLLEHIAKARREHMSWNAIGEILGTSGEAARQRYGKLVA